MALRAAGKVASILRAEKWSQGSTAVVLSGVSGAVATCRARFDAAVEAAGTFRAVEGSERAKRLALCSLLVMALAESLVDSHLVAAIETAMSSHSASEAKRL